MIDTEIVEVPNPSHPFGVRGVRDADCAAGSLCQRGIAVARYANYRSADVAAAPVGSD